MAEGYTCFCVKGGEVSTLGKHSNIPDSEFDIRQLEKGINIELEHTDNLEIAKAIAKDHLVEDKDYYKKLESLNL